MPAAPPTPPVTGTVAVQAPGVGRPPATEPAGDELAASRGTEEPELPETVVEEAASRPVAAERPRDKAAATRPAEGSALITKEDRLIAGHTDGIRGLAFSPDGRYLASCACKPDACVRVWDPETGREIHRLTTPESVALISLAFSPDSRRLLCGDGNRVRLWDVETGKQIGVLEGHQSTVFAVTFAHCGSLALTAGADRALRLWDIDKLAEVRQFTGQTNTLLSVAFSPDDRLAAAGGYDGTVHLWEVQTGRKLRQWPVQTPHVTAVSFSPEGRRLLTAGTMAQVGTPQKLTYPENPLCIWSLDGAEIRRLGAPRDTIQSAVFSPDGRYVLAAGPRRSPDGRKLSVLGAITVWDATSGQEVCRFDGHSRPVSRVCFSPDARHVVSASADQTIRFWRLPDSIVIEAAGPPATGEQRGLPDISKSLTEEVPALIEAGELAAAHERIDEARRDVEQFAVYSGVPRWDNSVGGLLRLADAKQVLLVKKGYVAAESGMGGGSEDGDPPGPASTERLTAEQNKELAAIRAGLTQATQDIRQGKFAAGQAGIFRVQEQLRAFVESSGVPEWHLAVASVYQLAAKRQTELDNRRGVEESRAAALAAEAAKQKEAAASPATASQGLRVGQPAPLFTAATVDGRPFALQQFRKKWVLIDFWATWCGPCRAEMPNLKDVYATFGRDKRFVMISLSIDNQVDDPLQYAQENGLGWVQGFLGHGWNSPVLKLYQVHGIPAMFLIDPDGKIAATGLRGERIKATIAEALGGK